MIPKHFIYFIKDTWNLFIDTVLSSLDTQLKMRLYGDMLEPQPTKQNNNFEENVGNMYLS